MNPKSSEAKEKLHEQIYNLSNQFSIQLQDFKKILIIRSQKYNCDNLIDTPLQLVSCMANQVYGEFQYYYTKQPDSEIDAICWLQKAFTMCRMFYSEKYLEEKKNSPTVSKMIDPLTGKNYEKLTSVDYTPTTEEEYGKPIINLDHQKIVNEQIVKGNYVQVIKLLCDSTKHGVLSPAINLATMKTSQQIYIIGLAAMNQTLDNYILRLIEQVNDATV